LGTRSRHHSSSHLSPPPLPHLSVAPNADSNNNTAEGEALDSEEYCRQLLTQALELTQNENLRVALQEIIDNEFGGGSNNIDFSRLTTAEVLLLLSSPPLSLLMR
jgi:hypothetical protein